MTRIVAKNDGERRERISQNPLVQGSSMHDCFKVKNFVTAKFAVGKLASDLDIESLKREIFSKNQNSQENSPGVKKGRSQEKQVS